MLPWLHLRRITQKYHKLSDHAIQLFFEGWHISPCKTPKFSTRPLRERHAFASIAYPEGEGCSLIISRAGDWTAELIDSPPEHLYAKTYPVQGVLYMAKMFKSVLCVVTGSGIAPILGLLDIPGTRFTVLWSAKDPHKTYGQQIIQRLLRAVPDAIILDILKDGRSDLVKAASRICCADGEIEAFFVISNPIGSREIVKGLQRKDILVYGPILDS